MTTDTDEKIKWYHSPIDRDVLRLLTTRSDAKGLLHVLGVLLLSLLTGAAAYYSFYNRPLWITIPLIYVHGTFYYFLGQYTAVHELVHQNVFARKSLNWFFVRLFSFLGWTSHVTFRASHMAHHKLTVHTGRDMEVELPYKVSRWQWFCIYTIDWIWMKKTIGTILRHSVGVLSGEWEHRLLGSDPALQRKAFNWARFVLAGHLLLAAWFILSGQWILLVLFTFAPFYAGTLANFLTLTQHAGLPPDVPDFRACCRTVKVNPFLGFVHWNMDYHIEHHMFASVPFYNLPRLRRAIEKDLPIAAGLVETWKELFRVLRQQKTDPSAVCSLNLPATAAPIVYEVSGS